MKNQNNIFAELDLRRRELSMPAITLAQKSGVAFRTTQRILSGKHQKASYADIQSLAAVLGMTLELRSTTDPEDLREQQGRQKAQRLMKMVQGTAALEAQAVNHAKYKQMMRRSVHELLAGPARKLWAE